MPPVVDNRLSTTGIFGPVVDGLSTTGPKMPVLTFYFFFLPLIAAPLHPYSPTPQQPRSHSPCSPARSAPARLLPCSPARLRPCSPADSEVDSEIATYFLLNLNG
ncbi:hypothetical protein ACOSP7_014645 [Xanthoceras sorbifolium]